MTNVPPSTVLTQVVRFEEPAFRTTAGVTRVAVAGCEVSQSVGEPLLPYKTIRFLLPPEGKVISVKGVAQGMRAIQGFWTVDYGRFPKSPSLSQELLAASEPDPDIYRSEMPFPQHRVETASVQRMNGYDVALVRVYPVQYRPLRGELTFAPVVEVTVSVETGETPKRRLPRQRATSQKSHESRIVAFVHNPEMIGAYARQSAPERLNDTPAYDYLLITKSNLVEAFQPLVNLKSSGGLSVKVETVEYITSSEAGRDVPEKIRNYIRYAYENWGISYVLLGGDTGTVPCRYAHVSMGSLLANPTLPTDLYYACLDGTWNGDGDGRWGEPDDGESGSPVDLLAEVYVGRAPVDTPAEVTIFVNKLIQYASGVHPNARSALFVAEFLGESPSGPAQGGDMFTPILSLFEPYDLAWLDDRPHTTPQWTRADALGALNQSPHLAVFNGHGDDSTLMGGNSASIRGIRTSHLDSITNLHPFFAYSVGCNVGQFDNDKFSPDAIGEELVKRHSRGAFAAIFNSRLGWYDPTDEARFSGEFQEKFFEGLLSQGRTNLGAANQLSKHAMLAQVESSGIMTYRWCYYEITLFGDPHLAWQAPSPPIAVTSHGTPVSWLASYGWTNDFEMAASADTDGDGMAAWQEYVAGTSPVDPASVLKVAAEQTGHSEVRLSWPSATDRLYTVWAASVPGSSDFVLLTNNLAATPPVNTFIDVNQTAISRFYRIQVQQGQ